MLLCSPFALWLPLRCVVIVFIFGLSLSCGSLWLVTVCVFFLSGLLSCGGLWLVVFLCRRLLCLVLARLVFGRSVFVF